MAGQFGQNVNKAEKPSPYTLAARAEEFDDFLTEFGIFRSVLFTPPSGLFTKKVLATL